MSKLVLIGGGGHCKSVLDSALAMETFEEIVITDAKLEAGTEVFGCRVVGTDSNLVELKQKGFDYAFITVGSIESVMLRKQLSVVASNLGFQFPVICDPTACVSSFVMIGKGTFVGKNVVINADVKIGRHCIINTGSILEHECTVGDYSHISVGAILCGNSHIGCDSFIGAGSTLIQGISVGDNTVVGAGSKLLADVEDNRKICGTVIKEQNCSKGGGYKVPLIGMPSLLDLYPEVA
ncbi:MAG: acetyltransferase [Lachnospiraceae bacterium]|nr:acetyltransferase [Lachnospiraceae bacterium]